MRSLWKVQDHWMKTLLYLKDWRGCKREEEEEEEEKKEEREKEDQL